MGTLVMVSPDPEITRVVKDVYSKLELDYHLVEASFEDAVDLVRPYENQSEEPVVVIARGATGYMIRDMTSLPVALIRLTQFDLIVAFWEAARSHRAVAYVGYKPAQEEYEFGTLERMFDLTIGTYWFESTSEVPEQVRAAKRDGFSLVVGGKVVVNAAREEGLQAVFVGAQRESVLEGIYRAQDIMKFREKNEELTYWLRACVDLSLTGLIALEPSGEIKLINKLAQSTLGLGAEQAVGCDIRNLVGNEPGFLRIIEQERPYLNQLVQLRGQALLVNKVPLRLGRRKLGTLLSLQSADKIRRLEEKVRTELRTKGFQARYTFADIRGSSPVMRNAVERACSYAQVDSTVLIYGETGTGKELFAQAIHNASLRKTGPFVAVNCAALPPSLLESELFGYVEGAFTGAKRGGKPGLFELAHGGTVFLDEISELPLELQGRLLRVLQEKEVMRVGGTAYVPIDVRVIAATNRLLSRLVEAGRFRQDLLYRIDVLRLNLPPLRARGVEIIELFAYLLTQRGRDASVLLEDPMLQSQLLAYNWPGNVREMENLVDRLDVLWGQGTPTDTLKALITELGCSEVKWSEDAPLNTMNTITIRPGTLDEMEAQIIGHVLEQPNMTQKEAAHILGISRTTLWKKVRKYNILT
jgi:transcriptional regulator with PAS, ATPase and Fis domain